MVNTKHRFRALGAALAFITLMPLVVATGAEAAADVAGPVLVSSTVTPSTLNIATTNGTVKASVKITDATGTSTPTIVMSHNASGQSQGFGNMTLTSGTPKNGTWESTITIPTGSATETWEVTLYPLSDTLGNRTGGFSTLKTITVTVTATKPAPTIKGSVPTITGSAKVGSFLTASAGTWSPSPVTLSYQWYRSGTAVVGATKATYLLTTSDLGKAMTVRVTGSKTGFSAVGKTSAATVSVGAGTLMSTTPKILGTPKVGSSLTATAGIWGPAPVALGYQWYRGGVSIAGATKSSLKLTSLDIGKAIAVRVTGQKTGYTPIGRTSAATTLVTR